jgi:hypothetical protein
MDVEENGSGLVTITSPDPDDAFQRRAPNFRERRQDDVLERAMGEFQTV